MYRLLGMLAIWAALAVGAAAQARQQPDVLRPDPAAQWRQEGRTRSNAAVALTFAEEGATITALAWFAFSGAAWRVRSRVFEKLARGSIATAVWLALVLASLT